MSPLYSLKRGKTIEYYLFFLWYFSYHMILWNRNNNYFHIQFLLPVRHPGRACFTGDTADDWGFRGGRAQAPAIRCDQLVPAPAKLEPMVGWEHWWGTICNGKYNDVNMISYRFLGYTNSMAECRSVLYYDFYMCFGTLSSVSLFSNRTFLSVFFFGKNWLNGRIWKIGINEQSNS